jgi:hypothetical protein
MAVERVFLGWTEPCLPQVARWLWDRYPSDGRWDLQNVVVVTPGRRASRRLLELLAEQARSCILVPPRLVTTGELPDLLYSPMAPVADTLRALLARLSALRQADTTLLRQVFLDPPQPDDLTGWLQLAQELAGLDEELAADAVPLQEVAARCEAAGLPDFPDRRRWQALTELRKLYVATLTRQGLVDRSDARLHAAQQGGCTAGFDIALVACADLNRLTCLMLRRLASPVAALIHTPQALADHFDDLGCLVVDRWLRHQLDLDPQTVRVVERPHDQAVAVLQAIHRWANSPARGPGDQEGDISSEPASLMPDQITVGVGDESAGPMLRRTLELAGVPARLAFGRPLSLSRPAMLLAAIGRCLGSDPPRLDAFAALLRHPDVEASLLRRQNASSRRTPAEAAKHWLTLLDRYATESLHRVLVRDWLGDEPTRAPLKEIYDRIVPWCAPVDHGQARPLPHWSQPIATMLQRVYSGVELSRHRTDDHPLIHALEAIGQLLRSQAELDPDAPDTPRVSLAGAITVTLSRLSQLPAAPSEGGDPAVEILGWLELQLDDAPAIAVTGLSEGLIPQSVGADAFLPDTLRRVLGLTDDRRRFARDLMTLSAIVASRRHVALIAARHDRENQPLPPSRLLLACDEDRMPQCIERFYGDRNAPTEPAASPILHAHAPTSRFVFPRPQPAQPIDSLPVTAFQDYLACPYRFYLKHVLKLRSLDDRAVELDQLAFGTLAHEVLRRFGRTELAASTHKPTIARYLRDQLDAIAHDRYGSKPPAPVEIQIEQLRHRLEAFAAWQAEQAKDGWVVLADRVEAELAAPLEVDGSAFTIVGRIDRIDRHADGRYRIIDYKTFETPKTPRKQHQQRPKTDRRWVDLQLPLYRTLAETVGIVGDVQLGYVALSKKAPHAVFLAADWSEDELASAIEEARRVIRAIRAGVFWPPGEPLRYPDGFERVCLDGCLDRRLIVDRTLEYAALTPEEGAP